MTTTPGIDAYARRLDERLAEVASDQADTPAPKEVQTRITGIDMARGLAMFAMTVVHFVGFRENDGEALATIASVFRGRAMPLFVMLGGIGVTFLTRRSTTPERDLIIRAAMLFALGLLLTEHIDRIAIILQSYGAFFILSLIHI